MTFDVTSDRLIMEAELRFVKVLYSDGYYELKGYYEFDERSIKLIEVVEQIKNDLMHTFRILENAERRIFRKHKVDARGKLNWKNFNHR